MLALLVFLPLLACFAILAKIPARAVTVLTALINLGLTVAMLIAPKASYWNFSLPVLDTPKLALSFGIIDNTSLMMLLLSTVVTFAAAFTGKAPEGREKLWYSSILLMSAGAIGAFASTNLFFFYSFHELALIPTFLMIGILGRGDRKAIAWKATIYLGFGSLVLLAGLVWLAMVYRTFSIPQMLAHAGIIQISPCTQAMIAGLLTIGFGTLVSLFPFHSWAAPAYASAPAPVSMLHAGVLKKFGLYGLLRLALPLLPDGMSMWLNVLLVLLVANVLWVGYVTVNQSRLDRLFGYSSVMHMGYIFLALGALIAVPNHPFAKAAASLLMLAHGLSIAMQFCLTDAIERRTGTLEFADLGGLAKAAPKLAFLFGFAAMASIGLPGLANFAGEFWVFLSAFTGYNPAEGLGPVQIACICCIWGVVIGAVYMLRAFKAVFQGPSVEATSNCKDLHWCECVPLVLLAGVILAIGCMPNLVLQLLPF